MFLLLQKVNKANKNSSSSAVVAVIDEEAGVEIVEVRNENLSGKKEWFRFAGSQKLSREERR